MSIKVHLLQTCATGEMSLVQRVDGGVGVSRIPLCLLYSFPIKQKLPYKKKLFQTPIKNDDIILILMSLTIATVDEFQSKN